MITLIRREDCCGCGACEQACPKHCINMEADNEGFCYPHVNNKICINCGLCEKVCPIKHVDAERKPLKVFAAINKDESIRLESASGGIFTLIAKTVLAKGGIVFGVKFDNNWNVVFGYTESIDGLDAFRRSKYVQAWVGDAFKKVSAFLKQGRLVLFTGTPCQIAGLRHYLRKDYENLLLMDLLCEGVPSPKVWKKYLNEEVAKICKNNILLSCSNSKNRIFIKDISFRNKSLGWKKYSFALSLYAINDSGENIVLPPYISRDSAYMQAMFRCLYLRPICYECPFKCSKSGSDITIADYWGIDKLHPEMDDNKGTSMVFLNTKKGISYFDIEAVNYLETSYEEAFQYNNVVTSPKKHKNRDVFYKNVDKYSSIIELLNHYTFSNKERVNMKLRIILTPRQYEILKSLWHRLKK